MIEKGRKRSRWAYLILGTAVLGLLVVVAVTLIDGERTSDNKKTIRSTAVGDVDRTELHSPAASTDVSPEVSAIYRNDTYHYYGMLSPAE